ARRNGLQGTRRLMIAAVIEQALERFPYRVIRLRTSDVLRASTAHDARRTSPPRVEEELLSQRSLARTGSPGQTQEVSVTCGGLFQAGAQRRTFPIAPHEMRQSGVCRIVPQLGRGLVHLRDEAVAEAWQRLDVDRGVRLVSECFANLQYVLLEDLRLDVEIFPRGVEQLVLAQQPPWTLDQVTQ